CPGGVGTKVGADKPVTGGLAISDPSTDTTTIGTYCWRGRFLGDANYLPRDHTNPTTGCFATRGGSRRPDVERWSGAPPPRASVWHGARVAGRPASAYPDGAMRFGLFYQAPESAGRSHAEHFAEMFDLIAYGESLGFDVAWLAEIHFGAAFSLL